MADERTLSNNAIVRLAKQVGYDHGFSDIPEDITDAGLTLAVLLVHEMAKKVRRIAFARRAPCHLSTSGYDRMVLGAATLSLEGSLAKIPRAR